MQYFAQDEATRFDPALTVYETLASGSPTQMIPAIRNILGGFLFSGDDVYKKASVLSGGERTRLAVARMLLRPSNTLLLDEPTNHLDIDSKEVLLDALVDYGGTLIFVSHDRYFVDRLATKIIDVGDGKATAYAGGYEAFLWHQKELEARTTNLTTRVAVPSAAAPAAAQPGPSLAKAAASGEARPAPGRDYAAKKRDDAEQRRRDRARKALEGRVTELEGRIGEAENAIKRLEEQMGDPAFYTRPDGGKALIDEHQNLMWKVGELLSQWEMLTGELEQNRQ
jgi:ATP-binding cassette subfamily F protein 3